MSVNRSQNSIKISTDRNYFLSFGFFFLCIIFGFGLCFGRVTRRSIFSFNKYFQQLYLYLTFWFLNHTRFDPVFVQAQRWDEKKMSGSTDPVAHRFSESLKIILFTWNWPQRPFCNRNWPNPLVTATSEKWPFVIDSVPIWQTANVPEVGLNVQWSDKFSVIRKP